MTYTVTYLTDKKAHDLYYKLHKALDISITAPIRPNGDSLSVHTNNIVCYLAKSIESGEKWYDASVDSWCDYFLKSTSPDEYNKLMKELNI